MGTRATVPTGGAHDAGRVGARVCLRKYEKPSSWAHSLRAHSQTGRAEPQCCSNTPSLQQKLDTQTNNPRGRHSQESRRKPVGPRWALSPHPFTVRSTCCCPLVAPGEASREQGTPHMGKPTGPRQLPADAAPCAQEPARHFLAPLPQPWVTGALARGLQLAELGDLVFRDGGHVPPEVSVLALLQLHVHLGRDVQGAERGQRLLREPGRKQRGRPVPGCPPAGPPCPLR